MGTTSKGQLHILLTLAFVLPVVQFMLQSLLPLEKQPSVLTQNEASWVKRVSLDITTKCTFTSSDLTCTNATLYELFQLTNLEYYTN